VFLDERTLERLVEHTHNALRRLAALRRPRPAGAS